MRIGENEKSSLPTLLTPLGTSYKHTSADAAYVLKLNYKKVKLDLIKKENQVSFDVDN